MAILPGAQVTFGEVMNQAYNLIRDQVNNLDAYTGALASNGNFNARSQRVSGASGNASAYIDIWFSGKPDLVSSATFKAHWDSFMSSYGFTAKASTQITLKGLIHFLTCLASYVSARFVIVTNPLDQAQARAYLAYGLPAIYEPTEMEPILASDVLALLNTLKAGIDAYKAAPCNISWGGLVLSCSCCSCSCSSSSCSCSSSSSSSSSSSGYIGWYDIIAPIA